MSDTPEVSDELEDELPTEFIVPEDAAGTRLDTWLSRLDGTPSRNRVQQLVKDGFVLVNGEPAKRSHTMEAGECVTVTWPPAEDAWPFPEDIPLDVVYDDDSIAIINKQAGLVVHPSAGNPDGTLVNALLHRFPELPGINGVRRPGIVHRLDRGTTGLMVVAKTDAAMTWLGKRLAERKVSRRYFALVIGHTPWERITVDAAVGRDPRNRLRRAIDGPGAREARSHFRVLARSHRFTLLECKLDTGRTHQIRIHCKHIGYPIACDDTYDGHLNRCLERLGEEEHALRSALQTFRRPWLHAYNLGFPHPDTGRMVRFLVPPPDDARRVLELIFGDAIAPLMPARTVQVDAEPEEGPAGG